VLKELAYEAKESIFKCTLRRLNCKTRFGLI
jgi:hypothetical protein